MPFILRAVTLVGINSVDAPLAKRETAWARLASDLDPALLAEMTTTIPLADAVPCRPRSSPASYAAAPWSTCAPDASGP